MHLHITCSHGHLQSQILLLPLNCTHPKLLNLEYECLLSYVPSQCDIITLPCSYRHDALK